MDQLNTIYDILSSDTSGLSIINTLPILSQILTKTSSDPTTRNILGKSSDCWSIITKLLQVLNSNDLLVENNESYRPLRGVILVGRNLLAGGSSSQQEAYKSEATFQVLDILLKLKKCEVNDSKGQLLITASLQYLSNFVSDKSPYKKTIATEIGPLFTFNTILSLPWDSPTLIAFLTLTNNCLMDPDAVESLLQSKYSLDVIVSLLKKSESLEVESQVEDYCHLFLSIISHIVCHKKFGDYLNSFKLDPLITSQLLKEINEFITVGIIDNDKIKVENILRWLFPIFEVFSQKSKEAIMNKNTESDISILWSGVLLILDSFSKLIDAEEAKKLFLKLNPIPELVSLLGTCHKHIERRTLKTEAQQGTIDDPSDFPFVKSAIIEIIGKLTINNFEIQEEVRKTHGLEVILSNCMIDDNNPFIKERSILCLKYLLENNAENQAVIANLEAKEVVSDSALKEAGYEVTLENGKMKLKHN